MGIAPDPYPPRSSAGQRVDTVLWAVAIGGLAAFLAILLLQHALVPELSPLRHTISEYANADVGALMVAGFLAWALSLAATAALVWPPRPVLGGLLVLAALGIFVTACWATQTSAGELPPGVGRSLGGRLHDLGSGFAALALLGAAIASVVTIRTPGAFRAATAALLVAATVVVTALFAAGDPAPGARQRLLVVVGCVWQALLLCVVERRPRSVATADQDPGTPSAADATSQLRDMAR